MANSTPWTITYDDSALEAALHLARGCYQRNLLLGWESLSGSTLRGKASHYGRMYALSRRHLLQRLTQAGIPWSEVKQARGKRVLVLGQPPTDWERLTATQPPSTGEA
jgi:hypothetical protein